MNTIWVEKNNLEIITGIDAIEIVQYKYGCNLRFHLMTGEHLEIPVSEIRYIFVK